VVGLASPSKEPPVICLKVAITAKQNAVGALNRRAHTSGDVIVRRATTAQQRQQQQQLNNSNKQPAASNNNSNSKTAAATTATATANCGWVNRALVTPQSGY
jgi:hypothetical protein